MTLDWTDGRLNCIYVTLFSICEKDRQTDRGRMTWHIGSSASYCSNGCFALSHTMCMYMCVFFAHGNNVY